MPQLGPDILHRPLTLPDFSSLGTTARWLYEGAISCLPSPLRNKGWRADGSLFAFSSKDGARLEGVIEKSWTGEIRRRPNVDATASLPAAICLDPELIFETHADLPLAARSTLEKTIALRMDELSPIPPDDAAFAIGPVVSQEGRLHADIAITRKNTLEQAKAAVEGRPVSTIGASPDENSAFRFAFSEETKHSRNWRTWLLAGAALWASVLLALSALASRQERMLAVLDDHQSTLRLEMRELGAAKEDSDLLQQFAPKAFTLADASSLASGALDALPKGAVIRDLSLIGDQLTVTGFTPSETQSPTEGFSRQPSDYPGFDSFTYSMPLQQPRIAEAADE